MRPPRKRKPLPLSKAVQRDRSFGGGTSKGSWSEPRLRRATERGFSGKAARPDGRNPTGEGKRGTPAIVEPNGACWSLLQQEPGYRTKQRCFTVPKGADRGRDASAGTWDRQERQRFQLEPRDPWSGNASAGIRTREPHRSFASMGTPEPLDEGSRVPRGEADGPRQWGLVATPAPISFGRSPLR